MAFTGGCAEETKYNKIGGFLFLNLRKWNQVEFRSVWENLFLNYSEITSCCPFSKVSISSRMTVLCLCRLASKIKNQRKCRLFKIKVLSITLRGSHYGFLHSAARLLAVGQTSADWRPFPRELSCSERHCSNSPVPTLYQPYRPALHGEGILSATSLILCFSFLDRYFSGKTTFVWWVKSSPNLWVLRRMWDNNEQGELKF